MAKQRFLETEGFVCKLNTNIAVIAGDIQYFFSAVFTSRQITLPFFIFVWMANSSQLSAILADGLAAAGDKKGFAI